MVRVLLSILAAFSLPFAAQAAALPSRDPQVVVPLLQAWREHGSFLRLEHILGRPDREVVSGMAVSVFDLRDGTSIYVKSTPSHNRIYTISRSAPGRLIETLYEPLAGDLDRPQPASAPF